MDDFSASSWNFDVPIGGGELRVFFLCHPGCSLLYFLFLLLWLHVCGIWKSLGYRFNWSCSCQPMPQPQQHRIPAVYVTYTRAHSNVWYLTHQMRSDIKPISSWTQWELPPLQIFFFIKVTYFARVQLWWPGSVYFLPIGGGTALANIHMETASLSLLSGCQTAQILLA